MRGRLALVTLALAVGCKSDQNLFEQEGVDTWAQAPNNEVDILWVIDDSASMAEEQDTLAEGFSSFGGQLFESGVDFHMGVITTSFEYADPDRGVLIGDPPFLTARDDYEEQFAERALVGIDGSDKEKGLEAAAFALHPVMTLDGGPNEGFVRDDAHLLVVVVSDEEDCSDNGALEGAPPSACYTDPEELQPITSYIQDLRDLKDDDDMVQLGAIVGTDSSVCPDVFASERYAQVAALTGGLVGDICQGDWAGVLEELGLEAVGIRRSFQLSNAAKPETLQVFVDDAEQTTGWSYDEATWFITFDKSELPPRGSTITATYTIQPGIAEPTSEADDEGT